MQRLGNLYFHSSRHKPEIALTFDDGPSDETEKILDLLKQYNAKATFFAWGERVSGREKTIERIAQEGHEIGNHSYEHKPLWFKSKRYIEADLKRYDKVLEECGIKTDLFRPPRVRMGYNLFRACKDLGKKIILLDVISNDWFWVWLKFKYKKDVPIKRIVKKVLKQTKNGSIINFHDYVESVGPNEKIIPILEEVLPKLKEKYKFVTVSELLN